jgi:hypothetical protein
MRKSNFKIKLLYLIMIFIFLIPALVFHGIIVASHT